MAQQADNHRRRRHRRRLPLLPLALLLVPVVLLPGCARPSKANIELRRQNADLRQQVEALRRQREGDRATIQALEAGLPTVERLPHERLETLYTTHGLSFGRLTGGLDQDREREGDEALRVVVTPLDEDRQNLKAAGSFLIELFDLALPAETRIAQWDIDQPTARQRWHGAGMLYAYVFELPWQRPPQHEQLTLKVTFTDALTGRSHTAQKVITVRPPGSTAAATQPDAATQPADQ